MPLRGQIASLEHGAHIVVGTPGRVMDHLERGSLTLEALNTWCWTKPTACWTWAFFGRHRDRGAPVPQGAPDPAVLATYPDGHRQTQRPVHAKPQQVTVEAQHARRKIESSAGTR